MNTKIKAEVIPDEKAVKEAVAGTQGSDNPGLPLECPDLDRQTKISEER